MAVVTDTTSLDGQVPREPIRPQLWVHRTCAPDGQGRTSPTDCRTTCLPDCATASWSPWHRHPKPEPSPVRAALVERADGSVRSVPDDLRRHLV